MHHPMEPLSHGGTDIATGNLPPNAPGAGKSGKSICIWGAERHNLRRSTPTKEETAMSFKWDRVHVWSGEIADQAGGAAEKLSLLAQAGANLEYIETQRLPNKPGKGIL